MLLNKSYISGSILIVLLYSSSLFSGITWEQKASFNHAHGQPAVIEIGGKIYLLDGGDPVTGSYDYGKLEMYDPAADTWTDKADMTRGKAGNFGALAANGKIYALGGEGPNPGRWSPEIYEYDPSSNSWSQKNNWSSPKRDFGYAELDSKIYIAGGQPNYSSCSSKFELYDPVADSWSELASLPTTMTVCPLAPVNDKIYMIGGRTGNNTITDWVYEYDPYGNTWTQKTSMLGVRQWHSLSVHDSKIYVLSGSDVDDNYIEDIWEYDPSSDSWAVYNSSNFTPLRGNHFWSPVIGHKLYYVGTCTVDWSENVKVLQVGTWESVPIELSSFTAETGDGLVTLKWTTQSETENYGFHIYRSRMKDKEYDKITKELIPGSGNSDEAHTYCYIDRNVASDNTYYYKLADLDFAGNTAFHRPISVTIDAQPAEYYLAQNYPNPFNPTTNINFSLKKPGNVTLKIYNLQGKLVRTLVDEKKFAGTYSMLWDGTDQQGMKATTGIYIYTLRVNRFEQSKKLVFVK
jgi:N-acetylneuraminic acid mutarotase